MRIDTNLSDEDREEIVEYARERGIRLSRAYTKLIKKGLEQEVEKSGS